MESAAAGSSRILSKSSEQQQAVLRKEEAAHIGCLVPDENICDVSGYLFFFFFSSLGPSIIFMSLYNVKSLKCIFCFSFSTGYCSNIKNQ